jgi:hypothetical protein
LHPAAATTSEAPYLILIQASSADESPFGRERGDALALSTIRGSKGAIKVTWKNYNIPAYLESNEIESIDSPSISSLRQSWSAIAVGTTDLESS